MQQMRFSEQWRILFLHRLSKYMYNVLTTSYLKSQRSEEFQYEISVVRVKVVSKKYLIKKLCVYLKEPSQCCNTNKNMTR